ncbi:MAG: alkylmercury lyase family protein [Actinobacteria bacterium]|nr:alkylmercury lyase family protein [Actinomycetota bacterium]
MLLFRSEEHLDRWSAERGIARGATMTVEQQWQLAQRWYSNRLDPEWARRTPEQAQEVFDSCGLTEPFWKLS